MEAFFHRIHRQFIDLTLGTVQFWDSQTWICSRAIGANRPNRTSDGHFGEDVHAADLGGHPEVGALFLDPDNRRLATNPALLA